jgi:L-threonylcarbamoyladenylate synthase
MKMSQAENARALKNGALIAFPTETVYGLGADAGNEKAVARIFEVKGRPQDHPLILHIASIDSLQNWAREIPPYAISLAHKFWPGPMTLIFNRTELAKDFVTGGQDTVGIRIPDHPIALDLLRDSAEIGVDAIAAPSANKFGHVSPTTALAVQEEIGTELSGEDVIIDGGQAKVGVESTIIDCTGPAPRILRPGAITEEMITECTRLQVSHGDNKKIRVSGSLEKHYAPAATVKLNVEPKAGEGLIAMAEIPTPAGAIRLAAPTSLEEYARSLYSALRNADAQNLKIVCVFQPAGNGLATAIRDRILRAEKGR